MDVDIEELSVSALFSTIIGAPAAVVQIRKTRNIVLVICIANLVFYLGTFFTATANLMFCLALLTSAKLAKP
jgi:hypothetical protein